jgi:hypothetical protein
MPYWVVNSEFSAQLWLSFSLDLAKAYKIRLISSILSSSDFEIQVSLLAKKEVKPVSVRAKGIF